MAEDKAEVKKNSGAGLRGQSAGQTAISTVGAAGNNLRYRGYNVQDLAGNTIPPNSVQTFTTPLGDTTAPVALVQIALALFAALKTSYEIAHGGEPLLPPMVAPV